MKINYIIPDDVYEETEINFIQKVIKICKKYKYVKTYHYNGELSYPDHFTILFYSNENFSKNDAIKVFESKNK